MSVRIRLEAHDSTDRCKNFGGEDEALIRMDLVEMLTEAGYDVVAQASNGEEAIALAHEHKPDLAILDVKMPVLDGISAAEEIISIAPVLMLTAFSQKNWWNALVMRALWLMLLSLSPSPILCQQWRLR